MDLTAQSDPPCKPTKYWLEDLQLTQEDKQVVSKGKWLTDSVITAAQKLMKRKYPHIGGLQNTVLAETLSFDVQRGQFVQVLNVSRSHWITVSNIGCKPAAIAVYDSMPSGYIPRRTKDVIASIVFSNEKAITLQFIAVQSQHGSNDCGLFALAFAASLCAPQSTTNVQHRLREHLLTCFENMTILPFPQTSRERKQPPLLREVSLELFCQCRLPEDGRMIH